MGGPVSQGRLAEGTDLLTQALQTDDLTALTNLTRQFLQLRAQRRESARLSPELVNYEQQREWLEGLARYAELEIWRLAATSDYFPISDTAKLTDFDHYAGFDTRWSQEVGQISRMAGNQGDGRFYYTGMAQAYLLDRLMPDWKQKAFAADISLEKLLMTASQGRQ